MKLILTLVCLSVAVAYPKHAFKFGENPWADHGGFNFGKQVADNVMRSAPRQARLIDFRSTGGISDQDLVDSLIDNATLIRENIVGGFDCNGRMYGYYADQNNDCQIFHVCVPLNQIYPDYHFTDNDIMHFAFICPKYTIFTQDAMVCAWERSAIPCEVADQLYNLNENFFIIPEDVEKEEPAETPGRKKKKN